MEIFLDSPFILRKTLVFFTSKEGLKHLVEILESNVYLCILIAYIFSPFDFVPECIFGLIGLIDDLFVLCIIFVALTNYYYEFVRNKDRKRSQNFLEL